MDRSTTPLPRMTSDMQSAFRQLQRNTINLALPGVFAAAVALTFLLDRAEPTWVLTTALGLLVLIPLTWLANRHSFALAALLLAAGGLAAVFLVCLWGQIPAVIGLLFLPVGFAGLAFGPWAGFLSALALSALLWLAPGGLAEIGGDLRAVAALGAWGAAGLVWLTLRPLMTAAEWSWDAFQHSQGLLAESRESHARLAQALEDLTNANTQLNHLNGLANNLRRVAEEERRIKEQFVANVSHELRTPLNMIIGFCEVILKSPGVYGKNIPGNLLADLQVVLRNSQHLSGLIDDVLDLSQIEARQMALVKEWVRVDEIVAAAAVAVRPLFESKGLALDVQVAADLPAIYCDRTRIREVLLNLLSNAGRFTERGGVRLRVFAEEARDSGGGTESIQRQAGARGPLALAEQKGSAGAVNVLFSVADDGPGISEEDRQKLFQPFQQLDPTIRRQHGGTGLGLSISKSFVELHEGLMWVESEKGKGTTFFFRLPVEPVLARSGYARWVNPYASYYDKSPRVPDLPAVEKRPRLMVVEARTAGAQDGVGQMVGGGVLERLVKRYLPEVEVTTALDLLTARAALEEDPAQMVLVNTGQGEDPTAALQAAVELPFHTPAVICSIADPLAYILPDDGDSGTGGTNSPGGPEAVLVKPISYDVLLGALERLEESCGRSLRTILIVDDEPDVHRLFWRMLSAAGKGYQVLRAEDGRQALDLLARQPVDAILLDLVMPEMDGFQFLAHRAQDPALCGVPVILISAQDQRGHPIVSNYLVAARSGGLSVQQVLDSIQAFGAILGHS